MGDPYYPKYGNGGYNVRNYDIKVKYVPDTGLLTGTTVITATAEKALTRFNVDFALNVSAVTVNGAAAKFSKSEGLELQITPATPLAKGAEMKVAVTYAGVPAKTLVNGSTAWVTTDDGAVAVGEPEIAAWWFPSNDHPRDKATFNVSMTVPRGLQAISNGTLQKTAYAKDTETWSWQESKPMATYLAFMAIGKFDITQGKTTSGLPWVNAVTSRGGDAAKRAAQDLAKTPEIVDWLASQYGPYPFDATGGVAPQAQMGFALENQTRPVYSPKFWSYGSNLGVIVHEQSHQWFGDSVSVANWKDMWLNEGFATWTEWRYEETHGGRDANAIFKQTYDDVPDSSLNFWNVIVSDPGPGHEFDSAVYDRGGMAVQALRNKVGDPVFWSIVRGWLADHQYGNAKVTDFVAYASKVSGQDLTSFFRAWLSTAGKPTPSPELGFPASMLS
ncbi:Aminopeptidase N [Austwickia sp. TVS 96-490-7B]|nr:Aminopeptidase N [Austwickia sp. TVS 96-490-7B]